MSTDIAAGWCCVLGGNDLRQCCVLGGTDLRLKLLVMSTDVAAGWCCVLGGNDLSHCCVLGGTDLSPTQNATPASRNIGGHYQKL
jgi:hypothetical protein